jgi:signal transduction histidine kinase
VKLRSQLFLVSLTFLTLPWAGCEYIKSNERTLRSLEESSLETIAFTLADSLSGRTALLYPDENRAKTPYNPGSLKVHLLATKPVIDGYLTEWSALPDRQFGTSRRPLGVRLAKNDATLYVGLSITDESKQYNSAPPGFEASGDRLVISVWQHGQRQEYLISTPAPGPVTASVLGRQLNSSRPQTISGVWTDVADGYEVELAMPMALVGSRLGLYYIDADEGGISTRGNIDPLDTKAPPWLVFSTPELESWLAGYRQQPLGLEILDRWGWPLMQTPVLPVNPAEEAFWLTQLIFAWVLDAPEAEAPSDITATGQRAGEDIDRALHGITSTKVIAAETGLITRVIAPVRSELGVTGVVIVRQPREQYLSLHASAFEGLLFWGLAAVALSNLTLLGYASLISHRISRAAQATRAMHLPDDQIAVDPMNDEITELVVAFNQQLERQRELRDYLTALPQTLAHEIRTPVAIVRTSLELLAEEHGGSSQSAELFARAEEGIERLTYLLRVMNEANRLEQAVGQEALEPVDLRELMENLKGAYTSAFPSWQFELDTDNTPAVANLTPEMVVQAMDKLVANATSFTGAGETITLRLRRRGLWWRVTVVNPGPALPADRSQLFEAMVSMRDSQHTSPGNLGLGLYIVKLVASHHGGEPWAGDHSSGAEVGFTLRA